jgi:hypothetical protein
VAITKQLFPSNSANQSLFKLSKSRFLRRLHRWFGLLPSLFHLISEINGRVSLSSLYFIDIFPVPFCEKIRIRRIRLAKGENYRGYIANKMVYFYGLKVHIVCDEEKFVHEFVIGVMNWKGGQEGDKVIGDKAYTCYEWRREGKG